MSNTKEVLYFGDSSEGEEAIYRANSIQIAINSLKESENLLYITSFILLEIGQSIIEDRGVTDLYKQKKRKIMLRNDIIKNINEQYDHDTISELLSLRSKAKRSRIYNRKIGYFYKNHRNSVEYFRTTIRLFDQLDNLKMKFYQGEFNNIEEIKECSRQYFPLVYCPECDRIDIEYDLMNASNFKKLSSDHFEKNLKSCKDIKEWFAHLINSLDLSTTDREMTEVYLHQI